MQENNVKDCYPFDCDLDTGHTQQQNRSLSYARSPSEVGPKGSAKLRSPSLTEGCSFTESLVDADVFGIGYMPRGRYF